MSKNLLVPAFLLCMSSAFAQVKGIVADSHTKEPLPYVNIWIEDKKSGASADENGNFGLPLAEASDNLIVSAVGYGNTTIKAGAIKDTLFLVPKAITLDEVIVSSRKPRRHKFVLNAFDKVDLDENYSGKPGEGPFMLGRYVAWKEEYSATPYLGSVRFRMNNPYRDMFFNLRLYTVNDDGGPGDFLYDKNILVTFKKKKDYAVADLSQLNIKMPEEGFFIVAEFIITGQNISGVVYDKFDERGKPVPGSFRYNLYGPVFVHEQMAENGIGWMYEHGKWAQKSVLWKGKYRVFAAEVTLTD